MPACPLPRPHPHCRWDDVGPGKRGTPPLQGCAPLRPKVPLPMPTPAARVRCRRALHALPPTPAQVRRRLHVALFYLTSLRRGRVTLEGFYGGVSAAYAACGFRRQLTPLDLQQLALRADFPSAAAGRLQAWAAEAAAERSGGGGSQRAADEEPPPGQRRLEWQQRRGQQRPPGLPSVGIPTWRYRYFMWWLKRWGGGREQRVRGWVFLRSHVHLWVCARIARTCPPPPPARQPPGDAEPAAHGVGAAGAAAHLRL